MHYLVVEREGDSAEDVAAEREGDSAEDAAAEREGDSAGDAAVEQEGGIVEVFGADSVEAEEVQTVHF